MKLAMMQPYFFPYIGYFQLLSAADSFILFDDAQYPRHGWINRNRVLKPSQGWQYIIRPVEGHPRATTIREIRAINEDSWKQKILRQLEHYRGTAPFYEAVTDLLRNCFSHGGINVTELNECYVREVCRYLNVKPALRISSALRLDYSSVAAPGDWALTTCLQLGASEYINPIGGSTLFDRAKFSNAGIKLTFLEPNLRYYDQHRRTFEPGLSIIDVLMFNSVDAVNDMLSDAKLS